MGGGDAAVQTTQNHPNRHSSLTLALSCMATTSPLFSEAAKLAADIRFLMILAAGRCGRTRRGTPHRVGRLDQHETASCVGRVVWRNPINRIRSYSHVQDASSFDQTQQGAVHYMLVDGEGKRRDASLVLAHATRFGGGSRSGNSALIPTREIRLITLRIDMTGNIHSLAAVVSPPHLASTDLQPLDTGAAARLIT